MNIDTIKRAARNFTLHGQDPRHDMVIQGKRVHYGTAGAAVHLVIQRLTGGVALEVVRKDIHDVVQQLLQLGRLVSWIPDQSIDLQPLAEVRFHSLPPGVRVHQSIGVRASRG